MILGKSNIDAVDLGEVDTPRLREQDAGEGAHIASGMRALKLVLHVLRDGVRLRKSEDAIVSPHPLEGAQEHGGLAMDVRLLALGCQDRVRRQHLRDALGDFDAILRSVGEDLCLEEGIEWREERLRVLKSPRSCIDGGEPREPK